MTSDDLSWDTTLSPLHHSPAHGSPKSWKFGPPWTRVHLLVDMAKPVVSRVTYEIPCDHLKAVSGNVATALEELMTLYIPERFILESNPVSMKLISV